jgi:hypothetical protein
MMGGFQGAKKPRITSVQTNRLIVRTALKDPDISAGAIKAQLKLSDVSEETIRNRLRMEGGFKNRYAVQKPFLTEKHMDARLAWAREHIHWTQEQWNKVLWTDESPFYLRWRSRKRVWIRKGQRLDPKYLQGTVKHPPKIMVWGCFTRWGTGSITCIEGIMDAKYYVDMVKSNLEMTIPGYYPDKDFIFQQDNDPKHKSRLATTFFEKENITVMGWPAQSPDLNPIENLWHQLNFTLKERDCKNLGELWEFVADQWLMMDKKRLEVLVDSMHDRCQAVIDAKGGPTKY